MSILGRLFYKRRKFYDDDFDWRTYTADSYLRRLKADVESEFRAFSRPGELSFDGRTGHVTAHGARIHPNQQLILETIGQLAPASVHEVGCGGGDHLATGAHLFPNAAFTGGDRGRTQLDLALSRHPHLAGCLGLQDITMPLSSDWPRADLVYTQAVIMHIHTAVSHFVALSNMLRLARRYVLLMENMQCHNFVADLRALHGGGHTDWDAMHLYQVTGSTGARAILASREPLDYPLLESDDQIRAGLKPSPRRVDRANDDSARAITGFALAG